MADNGFSIRIDLGNVMDAGRVISTSILPRVHEAIGAIANQAQKNWADAVMKAPGIWSEERKAYASSIKWEYVSDFHARVTTDYDKASQIEHGRPARDLKVMLNTSMKVRQSKEGKRYLIIPLRHNTPGNDALAPAMPQAIYNQAQNLAASRITGVGWRQSGTGAYSIQTKAPVMVRSRKYSWGDRLEGEGIPRNLQGMVRMDNQGLGRKRSSTYLTFRVMSEDSPGWIVPAKPGLNIVQNVVNGLNPVAERVIAEAVKRDLGG